jgi:hypothetical protein
MLFEEEIPVRIFTATNERLIGWIVNPVHWMDYQSTLRHITSRVRNAVKLRSVQAS